MQGLSALSIYFPCWGFVDSWCSFALAFRSFGLDQKLEVGFTSTTHDSPFLDQWQVLWQITECRAQPGAGTVTSTDSLLIKVNHKIQSQRHWMGKQTPTKLVGCTAESHGKGHGYIILMQRMHEDFQTIIQSSTLGFLQYHVHIWKPAFLNSLLLPSAEYHRSQSPSWQLLSWLTGDRATHDTCILHLNRVPWLHLPMTGLPPSLLSLSQHHLIRAGVLANLTLPV